MIRTNNKTHGIISYDRMKQHNETDSAATKTKNYSFSKIDSFHGL